MSYLSYLPHCFFSTKKCCSFYKNRVAIFFTFLDWYWLEMKWVSNSSFAHQKNGRFIHCNILKYWYTICPASNNGSRNKPSNSQKSFYTFVAWLWDEERNAEAKWSALFWQWEVFKSLDWWFSCRKGSNNSSFTGRNVLHYSTFIRPNIIMGTFLL